MFELVIYRHLRKGSLVGVVEWSKLGSPAELLGQSLNLRGVGVRGSLELGELSLKLVLLAELAEGLGKVDTLLTGNLGGGSVLRSGTITNGVSALGSEKSQVVVDKETSSLSLRIRKLVHQVTGNASRCVTGSPDEKTVWDLAHLLVSVLDDNGLRLDILDHGSGKNVDSVRSKLVLGVLNELLAESGKDVGKGFDKGDLQSVGYFRVPLAQVILRISVLFTVRHLWSLTIKKSWSSPAYSTPVGPPPTTTMCMSRSISSWG